MSTISQSRNSSSRRWFDAIMQEIRQKGRMHIEKAAAVGSVPRESQPKRAKERSPIAVLTSFVRPHAFSYGVLAVLSIVGTLLDLAQPLASKHIIDHLVLGNSLAVETKIKMIGLWAAGLLAILILAFIVEGYVAYRIQGLSFLLGRSLRLKLYRHILRLPLVNTSELKLGGINSRLNDDANGVSLFFGQVIVVFLSAGLRIVGGVVLIFAINWRLAALVVLIIPSIFITYTLPITRLRPLFNQVSRLGSLINERVIEVLGGLRTVRLYGRESSEMRIYTTYLNVRGRVSLRAVLWSTIIGRSIKFLAAASTFGIICIGAYYSVKGLVSMGDIIATALYAAMVVEPVGQVISSLTNTQQAASSMDRIGDILKMKTDHQQGAAAIPAPPEVSRIDIDSVCFAYGDDGYALQDVTLCIRRGEVVALVGRNGAGKTTLTDLLARFHQPTHGEIRMNGRNIQDYSIESYRQMLAIVEQDVFLFDGTIGENISYGRPLALAPSVERASRLANAHDWIVQLPRGYDTMIGERGVRLSGGQRQRLGIARALLRNASLLILDEATSQLDSESEEALRRAIADDKNRRATVIVAHRLSTIRMADTIYVLDQGRIVESGGYEDLIARNGAFYDMIHRERGVLI